MKTHRFYYTLLIQKTTQSLAANFVADFAKLSASLFAFLFDDHQLALKSGSKPSVLCHQSMLQWTDAYNRKDVHFVD